MLQTPGQRCVCACACARVRMCACKRAMSVGHTPSEQRVSVVTGGCRWTGEQHCPCQETQGKEVMNGLIILSVSFANGSYLIYSVNRFQSNAVGSQKSQLHFCVKSTNCDQPHEVPVFKGTRCKRQKFLLITGPFGRKVY